MTTMLSGFRSVRRSDWFSGRGVVTEVLKFATVQRNRMGFAITVMVLIGQPLILLPVFSWLKPWGLDSSPLEMLGLSSRNQMVGFAFAAIVGLHAYLSDASRGVLEQSVAGARGRKGVVFDKVAFGVVLAAVLAVVATASSFLAWTAVGRGELTAVQQQHVIAYWLMALAGAMLTFMFYYLLGLVTATVVRSKALSVVVAISTVWVAVPVLFTVINVTGSDASWARWLIPTEVAGVVLSWVPGGNSLFEFEGHLGLKVLVLTVWEGALVFLWAWLMRQRSFFPQDTQR